MRFRSLTPIVREYGFPLEFDYNDETFHGHQKALPICIYDCADKTYSETYGYDNVKVDAALKDKRLLILEQKLIQDGRPRIQYSIPYYVIGHSAYEPTINFEHFQEGNKVTFEILLVSNDGWYNRYITCSHNVENGNGGVFDFINTFGEYVSSQIATDAGDFKFRKDYGEYIGTGNFFIDMYDKSGDAHNVTFNDYTDIMHSIASIRVIGIE